MKVLQLINCIERGGGAEKFVLDLSLTLKKKGIDVEVLSLVPPSKNNSDFIDILKSAAIPTHFLPSHRVRSIRNYFLLNNFLRINYYDVIHVHLFPALYFCAFANLKGAKLLYTEHSTDNKRRHIRIFKLLDKIVYSRYNKIVCISEKVEELLIKHIKLANTTIIPNGIFVDDFFCAKELPFEELIGKGNEGEKIILMSARMVKGKDYMTVFKALKRLPLDIHLLCLGTGGLENEYRNYCKDELLYKRVHFLGLRRNVNRILKSADAIILSSEHEGFSLSMLEAMSSGNPFIASNVPGISDLVNGYAILFPLGDEQMLAEYIYKVLYDKDYRTEIIKRCQGFAKKYDIFIVSESYINLYVELCE